MTIEYVKLNTKSLGYKTALSACETAFKREYPKNNFSVTLSNDKGTAWVKTVVGHGATNVVASCRYENRDAILNDIYSAGWLPVELNIGVKLP